MSKIEKNARGGRARVRVRKIFLACPLMHRFGSRNRSEAVTRIVTRTWFLGLLTVTVSFTLLLATVLILIGFGFSLGAFTPVRGETSVFRDHSRIFLAPFFLTYLFHFLFSVLLLSVSLLTLSIFTLLKRKNIGNKIQLT